MAEKPNVDIPEGPPSYQLELEDLAVGDGDEAVAGHIVEVHYVGVSWKKAGANLVLKAVSDPCADRDSTLAGTWAPR